MKMTSTKAVAVGAALGVGLLVVLAAVPSQTDFDSTYFRTNALPVTIVGALTNWAKLSTNEVAGVTNITPFPTWEPDAIKIAGHVVITNNLGPNGQDSFVVFGTDNDVIVSGSWFVPQTGNQTALGSPAAHVDKTTFDHALISGEAISFFAAPEWDFLSFTNINSVSGATLFEGNPFWSGSGIPNLRGMWLDLTGVTATNKYGIRIENISASGDAYAIKTGTGLVSFGDLTSSTAGFSSTATDAFLTFTATGLTNTLGKLANARFDGVALTYVVKNSANAPVYTNTVSVGHAFEQIQAGGAIVITAGSGVTGTLAPQ